MAGDHKCPVCQATFTRPQHVARHMRSHTGDRPYKCRLCGDQFARSDLLSRHVNKCHAGDKPPTTTAPQRRKGLHGLSSTRATTSKQACDQCVINTLPCDGAFPCSKCSARKTPCTFVKFQRQTAPSGPGHKNAVPGSSTATADASAHSSSTSLSSFLGASVPRPDELFLVGPPPITVPSMAGDLFYPQQPHPQFAYPQQQQWGAQQHQQQSQHHARSLSLSSTDSGQQVASRMRHADLVRAGLLPSAYVNNGASQNELNAFYNANANPSPQPSGSDHWQFSPAQAPAYTSQQLSRREKGMSDSFAQYLPPSTDFASLYNMPGAYNNNHNNNHHHSAGARRGSVGAFSDDVDGDGDALSDHPSPSQCNSASSSSVHLPLVDFVGGDPHHQQHHQNPYLGDFDGYSSSGSHYGTGSSSDGHDLSYGSMPPPPGSRDGTAGRFATSFGGLSLSDAEAVTAQAQAFMEGKSDGPEGTAPFFSAPALKTSPQDSTPRPVRDLISALHQQSTSHLLQEQEGIKHESPSLNSSSSLIGDVHSNGGTMPLTPAAREREAELRELRDFWKQYLRTPLTGPSSGMLGQTPKAELLNGAFGGPGMLDHAGVDASSAGAGANINATTPSARGVLKRGLSRVASLPSVRTPPEEKGFGGSIFQVPKLPVRGGDVPMQTPGGRIVGVSGSPTRTEDDLKRYEQAVLARQQEVPLKLSIQPRRKGTRGSQAGSVSPHLQGASTTGQAQHHGGQQHQQHRQQFGGSGLVPPAYDDGSMQGMFVEPGPLAENPALSGLLQQDGGGTSSDEGAALPRAFPNLSNSRVENATQGGGRPSFKRLPSQTLENAVSKRAARSGEWGEDVGEEDEADGEEERKEFGSPITDGGSAKGTMLPPPPTAFRLGEDISSAGLLERYRRSSVPSGTRPGENGVVKQGMAQAVGSQ